MPDAEDGVKGGTRPANPWRPILVLGPAIAVACVARIFWAAACDLDGPLASGPLGPAEPAWFDQAAGTLALLLAVVTARGDWGWRYLMPALLASAGWIWQLLFVALRDTPTSGCRAVVGWIEWLPRRCCDVVARPVRPEPTWPSRRRARAVGLLLLASLLVHAGYFQASLGARTLGPDEQWYLEAADNIVAAGCFCAPFPLTTDGKPSRTFASRMPGYPLFLAACKAIAPKRHPHVAAGIQALAGAGTVWLVYAIAEVLLGPLAALFAGILYVLYAPLAAGAPLILTESLAAPMYALTALAFLHAFRRGTTRHWLRAGAVMGLAVLIRPQGILVPVATAALSAAAILRGGGSPRHAARALLVPAAFAVVLGPWWVRNALHFGTFVPTTTIGGVTAWAGNDLRTRGVYRAHHYHAATRVLRECRDDEVAANRAMWTIARRQWAANLSRPGEVLRLVRRKATCLTRYPDLIRTPLSARFHTLVFLLAGLGILMLRRSPLSGLCLMLVGSVVLFHLSSYAMEARYFRPLMPLMLAWAGVGAAALIRGPQTTVAASDPDGRNAPGVPLLTVPDERVRS